MAVQNKLREQLAQAFLSALQADRIPWKACWQQGRPFNGKTGLEYRGVNALMLSHAADELGYTDPRWCTYRQAQEKGWQVRRGEESPARVEYWAYYDTLEKRLLPWSVAKRRLKEDPDYMKNLQLRCRVYSVFNAAQMDGVEPLPRPRTNIDEIRSHRDTLVRNMKVGYREGGSRAYYSPGTDTVTLPPEASFDDVYAYTATFLHECGHATGHGSRLVRDLSGTFGSESYAKEELRAEIASAFTAQAIGLRVTDQQLQYHMDLHKAYIQSWVDTLKEAPEELFAAIKDANTISDYLLEKGEFQLEDQLARSETPSQCGIQYRLSANEERGGLLLRVSGQGPMPDFQSELDRPYQDSIAHITEVHIQDGVASVGSRAFYRLPALEKVWIPSSVERLGIFAFEDCNALQEIEYSGDWDQVKKETGCLPKQFCLDVDPVRESYLPVGARPDADGRPETVSSDFTPDALVRGGGGGSMKQLVSTGFRTETLDPEAAEPAEPDAPVPEQEPEL